MKIKFRAIGAGYFALLFLLIWYGHAQAATHTYRVTWDANAPEEGVDSYTMRVTDDTGAEVHAVDTVKAEVSVVLVRPAGSLLGFTVAACRPGKPPGTPECSNESNPVTVTVPHDTLQEPKGLRVITVTVEIRE